MKQNCLGFALGITGDETGIVYPATYGTVPENPSVSEVVPKRLRQLGFDAREVESHTTPLFPGEWLIAFWGFFPIPQRCGYFYDFHVAVLGSRGIWTHKNGWYDCPCCCELEELVVHCGIPHFFAIRKHAI